MRLSRIGFGNLVDVFIGLLVLGGQVEAFVRPAHWSRWQESLFMLALTVPLFFRRRWPVVVPVVVWAAAVGMSYVIPEATNDAVAFFVALWFAQWAAATNNPFPRAVGLLLVGYAASGIAIANVEGTGAGGWIWFNMLGTLAWFTGVGLRRRTEHAAALEERAALLERRRAEEARLAVAEERARIARELHDVIAHSVSVMTVQASGVRRLLKPEQTREREALEVVERTGREALAEIRRLLGVLRASDEEPELAPQPGLESLDRLLEQMRSSGLPVELTVEGDTKPLAPGVDLSVYRIVQEALTNALQHAREAHAVVRLRYGAEALEVEVENDGRSVGVVNASGHGLHGMRERVAICGGSLEAGPRPEGGYVVRATLPVESAR
jgi:signal transduction histidine kinase